MKLSGLSNISFSSASQGIHKEQYGEYAATLDCKGLKKQGNNSHTAEKRREFITYVFFIQL